MMDPDLCFRLRSQSLSSSPDSDFKVMVTMAGAARKFFVASMFMWILPLAVLYGFHQKLFPGLMQMSPESRTLLSGLIAVVSVNVVIGYYIYIAIKEPSDKHEPDPAFVASAKASLNQSKTGGSKGSAVLHGKEE